MHSNNFKTNGLTILYLSYYPLDYGIGASANLIDILEDMPETINCIILEPRRMDLPIIKRVTSYKNVNRIIIPIPLNEYTSLLLYPMFALLFSLKICSKKMPNIIVSMHHPFHILSFIGGILSRLLKIPHIIDAQDVWRPMKKRRNFTDVFSDILERIMAKLMRSDLWIFVSSECKYLLEKRANISIRWSLIFPNCISENLLKKLQLYPGEREINKKVIKLVFVGRVSEEYQLKLINPLLRALTERGYRPVLLILGHVQEELPSEAYYLGPRSREETLKAIAMSDVGIGPLGPTLAVPKKVIEYLLLGKIVITGKYSLSRDLTKKFSGYILEFSSDDDIEEFIDKLLSALSTNAPHAEISGELENFSCRKRIKAMLRKYIEWQRSVKRKELK